MTMILHFLRDERASSAVEYALIATFVALVLISAVKPLGSRLTSKFNVLANNLS